MLCPKLKCINHTPKVYLRVTKCCLLAQYMQVSDTALQGSFGRCSPRKTRTRDSQRQLQGTEQLTLYSNKRARGQQFSSAAQKSKSETRKILVMVRTMTDFLGSPRDDEESPSLEAFNNCFGQTSAGKVWRDLTQPWGQIRQLKVPSCPAALCL